MKLYKLLIRPILEFGAQIVSYSKTHLLRLERFQTQALRSLLGLRFNVKASVVRLLSGVESVSARLVLFKLNYFHKIRSLPETSILHSILKSHMGNISLVNQFRISAGIGMPEDFASTLGNYYGRIFNLLKNFRLQHEFQITTEQSKTEFQNFVKTRVLETSYERELRSFDGVISQSKIFKTAAMPLLLKSGPYPGVFPNSLMFQKKDRVSRNCLLRCLSGSHFASENFCVEFKLQNQRLHKKCNHCPFCGAPERDLSHFVNTCPKFTSLRYRFLSSLIEAGVEPTEDLMDVFSLFFIPFDIKKLEKVGILRDVSFNFAEFLVGIKNMFAS